MKMFQYEDEDGNFIIEHLDPNGSLTRVFQVTGSEVLLSGSLLPADPLNSASAELGSEEYPWKELYVESASINFIDTKKAVGSADRKVRFSRKDVEDLKKGKSLNADGHISASGDMHVVGKTHLEGRTTIVGETLLKGNTRIDGHTDIRGDFKVNGSTISNLKPSLEFSDNLRAKTIISSSAQIASDISGSFTSLSASIATDIGNAGGGTIDTILKNGSTNAVTNNAVYDGLALKLSLAGGTMSGLIQRPYTLTDTTAIQNNSYVVDCRAISVLQITPGGKGATIRLDNCTPAFRGQELTIIFTVAGTITHTTPGKSTAPGVFVMQNGSNLSVPANTALKFVTNFQRHWYRIS